MVIFSVNEVEKVQNADDRIIFACELLKSNVKLVDNASTQNFFTLLEKSPKLALNVGELKHKKVTPVLKMFTESSSCAA